MFLAGLVGFWVVERQRSATGASNPRRPHRHSACRLAPVRWTALVRLNQRYSWKPHTRKQAMAIARRRLLLCLDHGHFWLGERAGILRGDRRPRAILVVLVRKSNAKVSDGSQPPGTAAPPLGVPAGCRSLDRLVRLESWVPQEGTRPQASAGPQLPTGRRTRGFGQDEQNGQDASRRSPGSEPSCKSCSSCQR
jgi:hypothetical protein